MELKHKERRSAGGDYIQLNPSAMSHDKHHLRGAEVASGGAGEQEEGGNGGIFSWSLSVQN